MKKSKKIIFIIAGIFCIIFAMCFLLFRTLNKYTTVHRINWGIELPQEGAKDIFGYSTPSFHGDGVRYHVIDYPVEKGGQRRQNTALKLENIFLDANTPTIEQVERVKEIIEQIDVNDNMIPEWEKCKLIYLKEKDSSELFLFYLAETSTVYVVEDFR